MLLLTAMFLKAKSIVEEIGPDQARCKPQGGLWHKP